MIPVDASDLFTVEVDFAEDLSRADAWLSRPSPRDECRSAHHPRGG